MENNSTILNRRQASYDNMESPDYYDDDICPDCEQESCKLHGNYIHLWLNIEREHTAKADHFDKKDRLTIKKGQRYRSTLKKGLRFVEGVKEGYLVYNKQLLEKE